LERLVGKRVRGEGNIQIRDVNQNDMLPSEEWRQAQALTAAPKFNNGVTVSFQIKLLVIMLLIIF
jgi:hypothetical protein